VKLALLLLVCAALLSWGALRLDVMEQGQAIATAQRAQRPQVTPDANVSNHTLNVRDVSALTPTATTPLFRPAQTPAALAAPQPGQTFALTGVAGGGEARVAFLRDAADQQTFRARAGDDVRGWRVERLDERCITLARAGQRQTSCLS
jgi:hypothetical protein